MAKEVIFATLAQLEQASQSVVGRIAALASRVTTLEQIGGQPNIIERILVNGKALYVDGNKAVSIEVPTDVSQLQNGSGYQTEEDVDNKLSAIGSPAWDSVTGKPDTFPPSEHEHDDRYYTEAEIDQKLTGVAVSGHNHDDRYYTESEVDGKLDGKAASGHTHSAATQSAAGFMSAADKKKLDGVAASANAYSLPTASSSTLGGVKTGSNITNSSGTISITKANVTAALGYTPPTSNTWRGIQDNLTSTATDQSLSANQGKVLKGLVDGKAAASHTHDDRYYTESEMNAKLNGKANSSHTHNYAGSSSAGGTANSVNGFTFGAQTSDPGAGSSLTTNKILIVYV